MLSEGKPVGLIRSAFIIVNYSTLLFVSLVICKTTNLVCERYKAYELISSINHIPVQPRLLLSVTQIAFFLIIFTIWLRSRKGGEGARAGLNLFFSITDLLLALVILYFISLSHKGILFLVITNTVVFTRGRKRKYILLGLPILLYMILDSDLISSRISLYSLDGYLDFYDANARFLLLALRNLLFSANEVLFIIFMILEIQTYLEETKRVKELNAALYESSEQLRISNTQLREYALRNEDMARLKERNRLAREIHDTIGHYLTAMDMGVKTCLHLIEKSPDLVKGHLEKVNSLTKRSLSDVRRSIKELQPDALSRYSLIPALEELAAEISSVSRTKVSFEVKGEPFRLSSQLEEFFYRAVQEGISNSVRHGAASRIRCSLGFSSDAVAVSVEDNGRKGGEPVRGFGLSHLEQKTGELSGLMEYGKREEGGFFLHITIPQSRREHFDQSADS
ncbi:MAG: sensor histidine kinase [Spirochaetales bacterium]|nr:sensor histidine kinase [Spirochaetales bacterium]